MTVKNYKPLIPYYQAQWMMAGKRGPSIATGYSLSGPGAGGVGTPSTNFTVTITPAGGLVTGTVTVTPNDSGGGGTFTPSTVALTTASPSATFTYTAASAGTKTIATTNNGGLSDPSSLSYIASAALHLLNTLITYWKLDEPSAGGASPVVRVDSQGTNNLSDPTNAQGLAAKISNGVYFSSANYMTIAHNASLQVASDFTWSFWLRIDDLTLLRCILAKYDGSTAEYSCFHDPTTGFTFGVGSGGTSPVVGSPATINTWYHIVGWYDSTDAKSHMRINDTTTYVGTAVTLSPNTGPVTLGALTPALYRLTGFIDEVGFWKRKLSATEITALYNGGAGLPFSSFNP